MKRQNKRKLSNYLINFGIQRKIIVINLIFMLLVFILTMAILYSYLLEREFGDTGAWHFSIGTLEMSLSTKLFVMYIILIVTFIFAIATQLWMTHRICGALINFSNTFTKIREGDLDQRIHLRKDDLLKNEAEQFNEMIESISVNISALKADNEQLHCALEKIAREKLASS
jgi:methyl-accepting chemotaxis protein